MQIKISYVDDIEKMAGLLVKNGYTVRRTKVRSKTGKSFIQCIEVTGDGEIPETEDDE